MYLQLSLSIGLNLNKGLRELLLNVGDGLAGVLENLSSSCVGHGSLNPFSV